MTDNEITHEIIGGATEVHRLLGAGLLESAYEACLCHEFAIRKIGFQKQNRCLSYTKKQTKLDCGFRLDLLVEKRIVVELKSVDALAPIQARPAD